MSSPAFKRQINTTDVVNDCGRRRCALQQFSANEDFDVYPRQPVRRQMINCKVGCATPSGSRNGQPWHEGSLTEQH